MQEGYLQSFGAGSWGFVDGAYLLGLALGKCIGYSVLYLVGDVVYALATVLYEFGYGTLGRCGLEQLNLCLAYLEERGAHLLVLYGLDVVALKTQYLLIVGQSLFNAFNGNALVFDS